MTYQLLGTTLSPFARKVAVFLTEKDIPFDIDPVIPMGTPPEGWRDKSPRGLIPVLATGHSYIHDSSVICDYLERCHPSPVLIPDDPDARAQVLGLEEYVDSGMAPIVGPGVFAAVALAKLRGVEPNVEGARAVMDDKATPYFDYLEHQLGTREFVCGTSMTLADITIASAFVGTRHSGFLPDASRWPRLEAYIRRLHARPAFAKYIAMDQQVIGADRWLA